MAKIFYLPEGVGPDKGQYIVNDRYLFEDGQMVVQSNEDAARMEPILCGFFGCEVEDVEPAKGEAKEAEQPSLSAAQTKQ